MTIVLSTDIDILGMDAYNYGYSFIKSHDKISDFLDRGGVIAWGMVPTASELIKYDVEELVNKFKKLYGAEKILEMGQYLSKNFGLFSPEHLVDQIKEEFKVTSLDDLNSKGPEFFMRDYQVFRNNLRNFIGGKRLKEMEEFIIEEFNLHEEEEILFVFEGNLVQNAKMLKPIFINSANFYFTNNRVFAQGRLKGPFHLYPLELGIYGYIIPIKNIFRLRRVRNNIRYRIMLGDRESEINLKISLEKSEAEGEILIDNLLQMLNKEVI